MRLSRIAARRDDAEARVGAGSVAGGSAGARPVAGLAERPAVAAGSAVDSPRTWPLRERLGRLPLPVKRVRLWAIAIAIMGLVPIDTALVNGGSDFSAFYSAGATVGTDHLVDTAAHGAWQTAHGLPVAFWLYPAPAAYLWWPFAQLPIWLAFIASTIVMLSLVVVAAWLLTRNFGLSRDVALLLAFAWTPATAPAIIGQNGPLCLVLALLTIDGLRRGSWLEAGLASGLMLYKPTLALPLVGLLVLRLRYRELGVVAAVVVAAYFLGIAASAGDWRWPITYWEQLQPQIANDLTGNANKAISIPGLLGRVAGMPSWLPNGVAAFVVLLSLRGLIRAPVPEAGAGACLMALAIGPRVWGYEAGLLLPLLAWALAGGLAEPWRTRLIVLGVPLGLGWLVSVFTQVSLVAIVVWVATALWLWRWRPFGPDPLAAPQAVPVVAPPALPEPVSR